MNLMIGRKNICSIVFLSFPTKFYDFQLLYSDIRCVIFSNNLFLISRTVTLFITITNIYMGEVVSKDQYKT